MEIRIASYLVASDLLGREPRRWDALVMMDAGKYGTGFVERHTVGHLFLQFDDVEQARNGKVLPTREAVEKGLAFARGKERLLVSCWAGQSRSAAMGYLACAQACGVEKALALLDATRHSPNRLVVSLGAGILGKPEVLDAFNDWRRKNQWVRLADYLDDHEREIEQMKARGVRDRMSI